MITIGSDPEFIVYNAYDEPVPASDTYSPTLTPYGHVGYDGNSFVGELRPKYGTTILEHVNHIRMLMETLNTLIPKGYKAVAGACIQAYNTLYPIGGHIHVAGEIDDTPVIELRRIPNLAERYYAFTRTKIVNLFDKEEVRLRYNTGYGKPNYRISDSCNGIEFRSLPSWIHNPGLAVYALALTKLFVYVVIKNIPFNENIPYHRDIEDALIAFELLRLQRKYKPKFDYNANIITNWLEG